MATPTPPPPQPLHALIAYGDTYVQPLLLTALAKTLPPQSYTLISTPSDLPSPTTPFLQILQYESIDFDHLLQHPRTSLTNAYVIRKALIRKHYLSTTVANWIVKYPESVLKRHVVPSVGFEVDYAEFLDDSLLEADAGDLWASWERGREGKKEWWILKPGMSERGQGIRLFSSEEELVSIFEEWDPDSDDEEEDEDEEENGEADADARSDAGEGTDTLPTNTTQIKANDSGKGIITSQLRHFIAQPYISTPLLLSPPSPSSSNPTPSLRKFHIRTYVLAVGALKIYVYKPMLALFAASEYTPPSSETLFPSTSSSAPVSDTLKAHLTNTCLQDTGEREGSVGLFWSLPDTLPPSSIPPYTPSDSTTTTTTTGLDEGWKSTIFTQIQRITGEVFEAAARGMSIHFQALPNSFEVFGLDFMVSVEDRDGGGNELRTWLLEVNAFPDFQQTGSELKSVVEGLFEGVVEKGVKPFFFPSETEGTGAEDDRDTMVKVLDIDLGRR
ncbi:TTL-domain-containing protein [Massarina eburnea CBS 473.64]|uniref:TTL-domain-containing protein n=1 Tax=Massarina eburnea CBS 473.64 TaxID=1395130 RepID=A0A6A6SEL3_9PLEO|nr:TTL-domain-containing protein [Massarina eburnea CBS 473.64]